MMKAILASFFLAPLALAAQSGMSGASGVASHLNGSQKGVLTSVPPPACPVGLRAQHISDWSKVNTRDRQTQEISQRLHLSFSKASHPIAKATVNVSGWTVESRMEPAVAQKVKPDTEPKHNAMAVRTVTAQVTDGGADVWVPGLTGVSSIELVSLEYADGSTWTPSGAESCRFTPDPLMLIAGH